MNYSVLIVDDEEANLSLFKMVFAEEFEVVAVSNPVEAKKMIEDREFTIIISDQRMPELTGVELLTFAKEKSPATIRILMSGFKDIGDTIDAINLAHVYRYFQKPWSKSEIQKVLQEAVHEHEFMKKMMNE